MMRVALLTLLALGVAAVEPKASPQAFLQVRSKKATKGDGFDGFGAPDPFNQNDDDQVDQGEPNAPDQENPNEDANMVSDAEANDDDDSFVQVASKKTKKGDGFDGFGAPDPFNQNDDDQVDQGEPNAPDQENPNEDANMVSDAEANDDDDSFVQVASKKTKKGDGFDGFGAPDPFNQNDDDQVDQGEPNAPDQENPNEDANMVSDAEANDDDDSFVQVSKAKRNIDDDNAEAAEMARLEDQSDKDMGEDDNEAKNEDDDTKAQDEDSFIQVKSKKNIDDDNAEAAEMARLEDQSDKDMGEDDNEAKTDDDDKEGEASDE